MVRIVPTEMEISSSRNCGIPYDLQKTDYLRMKIFIIVMLGLGFLLLNASSCCKENTLPPETEQGKNTFGCLVNGVVWKNRGQPHFGSPNLGAVIYENEFRIIATNTHDNIYQGIVIFVKAPLRLGIYKLNNANSFAQLNDDHNECYYKTDSISSTGTLEITKYDSTNKIVSGIFNFKAAKYSSSYLTIIKGSCDSIITITEGRFDIDTTY